MKRAYLIGACLAALAIAPAHAQGNDWLTRCNMPLGNSGAPESGKYLFLTAGKVIEPALARFDYSAAASARAAVYPTDAKDLLNPYSSPSLAIGYYWNFGSGGATSARPEVGHVSFGSMGKDFKAIPGAPVSLKLVIDGATFGPYEINPASLSSGQYSVWLDTANTDGDSKPPILTPADFAKLAKSVDAMKSAEIVLVREGADIVRTTIPSPNFVNWRDALPAWATKTQPGVGAATSCRAGGDIVN